MSFGIETILRLREACRIRSLRCRAEASVRFMSDATVLNHHGDPGRIRIASGCVLRGELLIFPQGGFISIGKDSFVGASTHIWSAINITIGSRVLISHQVNIFDSDTHPIDDPEARHSQFISIRGGIHPIEIDLKARPVIIGDDALICCGAIILKGVSIGSAAVVGAGAVVVSDVPARTVVVGNPARVVREIA